MFSAFRSVLLATLLAAALLALLWFYAAPQTPLSPGEVDAYMAKIEAQTQQPGGRHDLVALRRFLEEDDGAPFYTVNLYGFRDVARYDDDLSGPQESLVDREPSRATSTTAGETTISGADAFDRFSAVMIPMLVRQASHPVFGTRWSDPGTSDWDRLVIVRYRSRRDIAEVFANDAFAEASAHKWAAIANHDRLLVQGLQVPEPTLPLLALAVGALTYAAVTGWRRSRAAVTST